MNPLVNDMWWSVLKVDIDFSDEPKGMGHYESWGKIIENTGEEGEKIKPHPKSNIRINHKRIYNHLREKLNRKPNEKELQEYIKRVIMHEGTHAAHDAADDDFWIEPYHQKEYLAYMGMFPQNPYIALQQFLEHPDSIKEGQSLLALIGLDVEYKEAPAKIARILQYVDRFAKTSRQKNKLVRLELAKRKDLKDWNRMNFPQSASQMLARYGKKHKKFIYSLQQKPPGGR